MNPITNPTPEQLRTLRGIVYGIRNIQTNMFYVGQSVNSFHVRYKRYKNWHQAVVNPYLKNAIKHYGLNGFEIWILEHSIVDEAELNRQEAAWAEKLNAYAPHGYNLAATGEVRNRSHSACLKRAMSERASKTYVIKKLETGEVMTIKNLKQFAASKGMAAPNMRIAIRRIGLKCHGIDGTYVHPETTQDDIDNQRLYARYGLRAPFILQKDGQEYKVQSLQKFAHEHDLLESYLWPLIVGKIDCYRGFRLASPS